MYNIDKTYTENLVVPQSEAVQFLDFELCSRIGIAAGPLLNSDWVKVYANLGGYSMLTYKTVRTKEYSAYPWPNILYVDVPYRFTPRSLPRKLTASLAKPGRLTITNSFGMPSADPDDWMPDVALARTYLHRGQILVVSVVGDSPEDFALCAHLAATAGAQVIEANMSCPNKSNICKIPREVEATLKAIRERVHVPLIVKMGYFYDLDLLRKIAVTAAPYVDGFVSINAVKFPIETQLDFRSESGVCGWAIRDLGLHNVKELCRIRESERLDYKVIGCGGIMSTDDIKEYLAIGADMVEVATATIFKPLLGMEWKHVQHRTAAKRYD